MSASLTRLVFPLGSVVFLGVLGVVDLMCYVGFISVNCRPAAPREGLLRCLVVQEDPLLPPLAPPRCSPTAPLLGPGVDPQPAPQAALRLDAPPFLHLDVLLSPLDPIPLSVAVRIDVALRYDM